MADLKPAYLVLGSDRSKVAAVLARMRRHFEDDGVEVVQALVTSGEEVVNACMMMGLFASRRLIVVQGADAWKSDDVAPVLEYLKAPSEDTVLLLLADKLAANSRLKKAFGPGTLLDAKGPEKEPEVVQWVGQRFAEHGVEVSRKVAQQLVSISGHDSLDRLEAEVARIVTYAGDDPVTPELVEQLGTPHSEEKVWALTDAWASRDRGALLRMAEQLLAQREHPVRLVGVIGRHLRYVHQARRLLATNSPSQVQQQLTAHGANAYVARRYVEQAQRINLPQADAALARVALLDAELKGGAALGSGRISGGRDAATIVLERGLCELV